MVDDGSTDDSANVIDALVKISSRPARVVRQANAGAYAARNTGLDHARGDAVAFFDSDDLWLPHHLARCADALARHPELDWVYGSCRVVDLDTGRELEPSTFYQQGRPRPFIGLTTKADGLLSVINDDRTIATQIRAGLYCGLQNSVIRRSVFERRRFWPDYLVVEDELFVIRLLADGGCFGYFDDPHVVYRVHGDNSSGSATGRDPARSIRIFLEMVRGLERIQADVPLPRDARQALRYRLAHERFWGLGYNGFWQQGSVADARACYRQSIGEWPYDLGMWKTFIASFLRSPAPASRS